MQSAAVEEVGAGAGKARDAGGVLPLALGGKAGALPTGVSVGLVEAHVADRLVRIQIAYPREGPDPPAAAVLLPVERRRPTLFLHFRPAVRQPEEGVAVAAVRHELQVLAVGDQAVAEGE